MTWTDENHQHRMKATRLRLKAARRLDGPYPSLSSGNCRVGPLLGAGAMAALVILRPSFKHVPKGMVYRGPALQILKRMWWQLVDMLPGNSSPRGRKVRLLSNSPCRQLHELGTSGASPPQHAARVSSGSTTSASPRKPQADTQTTRKAQRKQKKGRRR
ncbi:hypothetical protein WJX74_006709 [Apatococcus lobatus]|uniref:Uncharacterized protein n=1 Tax=Apatococcus lobatus TaxID=904363 RepID=A0AAW1R254_9CHLO